MLNSAYYYAVISTERYLYIVNEKQFKLLVDESNFDEGIEIRQITQLTESTDYRLNYNTWLGPVSCKLTASNMKEYYLDAPRLDIDDISIISESMGHCHDIKKLVINPLNEPNFFD